MSSTIQVAKPYRYRSEVGLVLAYTRDNRYSVNALLAALEARGLHREVSVYLLGLGDPSRLGADLVEVALGEVAWLAGRHRVLALGLSLMSTSLYDMLPLIRGLRGLRGRLEGRLLLVAGGPHASGDPYGTLELGFDAVFIGEAEESFTRFVELLASGSVELCEVPGVGFLDDGRPVFTRPPSPVDLDEYPSFPVEARRLNPIEISRGCPHACRFCQVSYVFGRRMRHRSAEVVLDQVEELMRLGARDVRFITPNSLAYGSNGLKPDLHALEELLAGLHELVVERHGGRVFIGSFPSEVRPEFVGPETLDLLSRYASGRRIIVGAQSGSDRVLRLIGRGHTVDDVLNAVEEARRRGFRVDVDFIFGLPCEEPEDAEETVKVMERIVELGGVIHAHYFIPLPGTPLACSRPRPVHPLVRRFIRRYTGRGRVYGYWRRQVVIARRIVELVERGVIKARRRVSPIAP